MTRNKAIINWRFTKLKAAKFIIPKINYFRKRTSQSSSKKIYPHLKLSRRLKYLAVIVHTKCIPKTVPLLSRSVCIHIETVHTRQCTVKQNHRKIYDSAIDVYDRGDFGKAHERHDVQIIPPDLDDVSPLAVCSLLFHLDDPRKTKQFWWLLSCVTSPQTRDSISFPAAIPSA